MSRPSLRSCAGRRRGCWQRAACQANTLTWSSTLDALSMDPHATNNSFTNAFVGNVYEALVRFDDKLQIEPALATSWKLPEPDGLALHAAAGREVPQRRDVRRRRRRVLVAANQHARARW